MRLQQIKQKLRKYLILKNEGNTCNTGNEIDATLRAMEKYSMHPNIVRIKNKCKNTKRIFFRKYR